MAKNKSFLERLTGNMRMQEEDIDELFEEERDIKKSREVSKKSLDSDEPKKDLGWSDEQEAELTVDLYETSTDIIVQTMVAGVQPENLSITITRDMIIIKGKREENQSINKDNYFVQELYWGSFGRTISLPEEVDPEEAEAIEKHGLLIIKLPKINKEKETKLKVKSI